MTDTIREDYASAEMEAFREALDEMVNRASLAGVIEGLSVVCDQRAAYVRQWDDNEQEAERWEDAARALDRAIMHSHIRRL